MDDAQPGDQSTSPTPLTRTPGSRFALDRLSVAGVQLRQHIFDALAADTSVCDYCKDTLLVATGARWLIPVRTVACDVLC